MAKKLSLFHPQKNNYFYGKLMTVRDFKAEQTYHDSKRWLINELVLGSGIVSGLKVTINQDKTGLDVYPGVAIDASGQEIIVPDKTSIIFNADKTNGFIPPQNAVSDWYLLLEYAEGKQDKTKSITQIEAPCEEKCEYNYINELYQLSFIPKEQDSPVFTSPISVGIDVLKKDDILVQRSVPIYARSEDWMAVQLRLQNGGTIKAKENITVTTTITGNVEKILVPDSTDCVDSQVVTTRLSLENSAHTIYIKTGNEAKGDKVTIDSVFEDSKTNGRPKLTNRNFKSKVNANETIETKIVTGSVIEELVSYLIENEVDPPREGIVLAQFSVVPQEEDKGFNIKNFEYNPFNHYVYNNELLYELINSVEGQVGPQGESGAPGVNGKDGKSVGNIIFDVQEVGPEETPGVISTTPTVHEDTIDFHYTLGIPGPWNGITTGVCKCPDIKLNPDEDPKLRNTGEQNKFIKNCIANGFTIREGQNYITFFTNYIDPGLFNDYVLKDKELNIILEPDQPFEVDLKLEISNSKEQEEFEIVTGEADFFQGISPYPPLILGSIIDPHQGLFRIGIRINLPVGYSFSTKNTVVRWWAKKAMPPAPFSIRHLNKLILLDEETYDIDLKVIGYCDFKDVIWTVTKLEDPSYYDSKGSQVDKLTISEPGLYRIEATLELRDTRVISEIAYITACPKDDKKMVNLLKTVIQQIYEKRDGVGKIDDRYILRQQIEILCTQYKQLKSMK